MISVIVPVYNTKKYLRKCVDSILAQTYTNFELLLIDDGSTDGSSQICDEYALTDNRVRTIQEKNSGSAAARNRGIDNCIGEFIMFVDSDDWLEHDAIQCLTKKQIETNADIVSGNAIAHYPDNEILMTEPQYADKDAMMRHMVKLTIDHVFWKRIIRRSLFTDNDIHCVEGINIGEDHHTLPRLIYYARNCVALNKVVYHYNCMNQDSYMRNQSDEMILKRFHWDLASIDILLDFFKDKDELSVVQLNDSRAHCLFDAATSQYLKGNSTRYNEVMKMLFSMGNEALTSVHIKGCWQQFVYKTYMRFYIYNKIKMFLSDVSQRF